MKLRILFILFSICLFIPAFSQKNCDEGSHAAKRKEMTQFKLDYLAKEIDLREDQKKQFYELYGQMEAERRAIFKKMKAAEKSISENKNAGESDYDKATKEINAAKSEMAVVEKQYDDKFSTFLSKKQMYKLKEAEAKFTQKMQECRDKKRNKKK